MQLAPPTKQPSSREAHEHWILVASVLASGMAFIDATALNVAIPAIQQGLGATGRQVLWIVNSYTVVTAALILFGGALGDRLGRRRVFASGIGLFVVASLVCGLALNTTHLIVARGFQGLGAALMIPGSLALLSSTFEPSRRGRAIGIWSACSVVMTALGPILGGALADAGWWRAIFFINLPIGLAAIGILCLRRQPIPAERDDPDTNGEVKPASWSLDYAGAAFSIVGLSCLNFGLIEVASLGWKDPVVVGSVLGGCGCLAAFIWNERRSTRPMLPMVLFTNRTFVAACQLSLCFYSGLYAMLFFLSLNLIQVQNYPSTTAGLAQLPVMMLVIVISPLAGYLVDRLGPRIPLTLAGTLATIGFAWFAFPSLTSGPSDYWVSFFPPLMLIGMAMGLSAAPLSTTIMNCVPQSQLGIASGINSTLSRLSSVLGLALLGPIAIIQFRGSLLQRAEAFSLDAPAMKTLEIQSRMFADAAPPAGLSESLTTAIEQAIRLAYVDAFRLVACLFAVGVGVSTLATAALIQRRMHP